jgi:uncharacterized membrane protein
MPDSDRVPWFPVRKVNLERLTTGFFAFSMILLVKNIQVPNVTHLVANADLVPLISGTIAGSWEYLITSLIVLAFWISNARVLHMLAGVDWKFLYRHFAGLLMLVCIPVTSLLDDIYGDSPGLDALLHLNVLLIGICILAGWWYALKNPGILRDEVSPGDKSTTTLVILVPLLFAAGGFLVSIAGIARSDLVYLMVPLVEVLILIRGERVNVSAPRPSGIHPPTPPPAAIMGGPVGNDLLEMLENAVFAFTMTLIVKNIPLPTIADAGNSQGLQTFLFHSSIDGFAFIFTFLLLAILWTLTFEVHQNLKAIDTRVVALVLLLLVAIVFVPITSLFLAYFDENNLFAIAFHVNILFCSLLVLILWHYASQRDTLLRPDLPGWVPLSLTSKTLILPFTAVIGIMLSLSGVMTHFLLYLVATLAFIVYSGKPPRIPLLIRRLFH